MDNVNAVRGINVRRYRPLSGQLTPTVRPSRTSTPQPNPYERVDEAITTAAATSRGFELCAAASSALPPYATSS
ncbi:hypothetical protein RZS08_04160, partial [Arthrospira platensis SPKY1]|nr:hypothetical protein [Arthrospira platensis SPKY1]